MTKNEKYVLKYILLQERKSDDKGVYIIIVRPDVEKIKNISEELLLSTLINLEAQNLIKIHYTTPQRNLSAQIRVYLNANTVNYFSDKKKKIFGKFFSGVWDFIKFIVPTILSILALIISILSYIKQ